MITLGIDTTADDTCAAIVGNGKHVLSNIIFSQSSLHGKFGGIVPQIASYEHLHNVIPCVDAALRESGIDISNIDLFSVGLSPDPALSYYFISLSVAKVFSLVYKKPLVGIDHMEGHIMANFAENLDIKFPFVALTVAGGHTLLSYVSGLGEYQILGHSRDDAAGEAFDKVARLLKLGYPGGPVIDKAADKGNDESYDFPSPMIFDSSFDFSYSGLKTSVVRKVRELENNYPNGLPEDIVNNLAASFRKAAIRVLVEKLFRAVKYKNCNSVVLGGGVAANKLLRELVVDRGKEESTATYFPTVKLCTDNAVGTAIAGYYKFLKCGGDDPLTLKHYREKPLTNWFTSA